jgi:hypothetical protein
VKRSRHAIEGAPYQSGELVAGRFLVRDFAAAGPLGWMYKATAVNSGAVVALKILSPRFLQLPDEKRAFADALRKAHQLVHPNIARIYDAGGDRGRPYVASQHLEGLTLRRIMELRRQKGQRFTLTEVEPIIAQIAAALDAAAVRTVHGNLKPDNVIVLPDLLKLTDFGLAVSLPRAPFMAAQRAAGVHRYLAPELLLGEPLDARTDVYSLGVLLGELLTGAPHEPRASLHDRIPGLPARVENLFRRAISPRPAARFPTAGELAAELSELIAVERPQPAVARGLEDAGDVLIVESRTDPRVRIARALGATRAAPVSTPHEVSPDMEKTQRFDMAMLREDALEAEIVRVELVEPVPAPLAAASEATPVEIAPSAAGIAAVRPRRGYMKKKNARLRARRSLPRADNARSSGAAAIGPTTSFGALEHRQSSRVPKYAIAGAAAAVLIGFAWNMLSSPREPAAEAQATATEAPKPVEPPKPPPAQTLEEKVRSVRERAEKALYERRQKREAAAARRAAMETEAKVDAP